jgi:hypothetical protein
MWLLTRMYGPDVRCKRLWPTASFQIVETPPLALQETIIVLLKAFLPAGFQRKARTRTALINWLGRTAPIDKL